ncbi:MAG: dockerin type I repeat-containing protein [Candidatus Bathyarchaeia archaeon]
MKKRLWLSLACFSGLSFARLVAEDDERECPLPTSPGAVVFDDRFHYVVTSAQGAVGDVVGVDVGLVSEVPYPGPGIFDFVLCYDGALLELLGEVQLSSELDPICPFCETRSFVSSAGRYCVDLGGLLGRSDAERYFPSSDPLMLATVYFRLNGKPGDTARLEFCDGIWDAHWGSCADNAAYYRTPSPPYLRTTTRMMSRTHLGGEIRILEGPSTQPEPPPMPPLAKVYPEAPSPESAAIHFEMAPAVARPGAKGVPLDVFATSAYEFNGFALSIVYPAEYLSFAGVEHHTRPGAYIFDDERGVFALALLNSNRRVGSEGERVKLVTLRYDLEEGADLPAEIRPEFSDFSLGERHYFNCLYIRHGSSGSLERPVTSSVEPVALGAGALKIQREPALPGDTDLDGEVTLSDAVGLLLWLFQGGELLCPPAAEANGDGRVDVSDAVAIRGQLFLGGPERVGGGVCDETGEG